jgi:hypothetical protein
VQHQVGFYYTALMYGDAARSTEHKILCSVTYFYTENHAVYEITCKNYGRDRQATDDVLRRMRIACWITKAEDTPSKHVIPTAVAAQRWLRERSSVLRVYVHCLPYSVYGYPGNARHQNVTFHLFN